MQLNRQHRKLQVDLENEIEIRKRSESMLTYMSNEKKHSEEQIENLLNKVLAIKLMVNLFISPAGLRSHPELQERSGARKGDDGEGKAVGAGPPTWQDPDLSELTQARANEEKLRKAAETRETRAQGLLLEEIRKTKDLEIEKTILQVRSTAGKVSSSELTDPCRNVRTSSRRWWRGWSPLTS